MPGWVSVHKQVSRNNFRSFLALRISSFVSGCRVISTSALQQHVVPSPVHSAHVSHPTDLSWMAPVRKMNTIWPAASTKPKSYSLYLGFGFLDISRYLILAAERGVAETRVCCCLKANNQAVLRTVAP